MSFYYDLKRPHGKLISAATTRRSKRQERFSKNRLINCDGQWQRKRQLTARVVVAGKLIRMVWHHRQLFINIPQIIHIALLIPFGQTQSSGERACHIGCRIWRTSGSRPISNTSYCAPWFIIILLTSRRAIDSKDCCLSCIKCANVFQSTTSNDRCPQIQSFPRRLQPLLIDS